MVYFPNGAIIPDKVCVVGGRWKRIVFSSKVQSPPSNTIAIVNNIFTGPFTLGEIRTVSSSFFSELTMKNVVPSNNLDLEFYTDLRYWNLNELILSGLVQKGGILAPETEFVAVTYSCHSTVVLKDGELYKAILEKMK